METVLWSVIGILVVISGIGGIACLVVLARSPYKYK
jgi:hypothetical protein